MPIEIQTIAGIYGDIVILRFAQIDGSGKGENSLFVGLLITPV